MPKGVRARKEGEMVHAVAGVKEMLINKVKIIQEIQKTAVDLRPCPRNYILY